MTGEPSLFAIRDLVEILWLPLLIGVIAAAATWAIWYYTTVPCSLEAATLHFCNPALVARYVNVEIWARCLTLGTLAGGLIGGGVNYAMFSRERAARIAAETMLAEERKINEKERKRTEEERKRVDQLVAQFTETQQAMLSAITTLTAEVAELSRERANRTAGD